ncbi:peptidoglycan-binding protein [Candidatus Actinomarina sp.]|nr:peptidoglycan-binding protein [Candidatus Actinomarina sp.]MDA8710398.1 peptidoglycan-binding protein [Candidatus Actinomarina sp.]
MLQNVLKSYAYYEGKIDGNIGSASKAALRSFQDKNGLIVDGILGPQTCLRLLDRVNITGNFNNLNANETNNNLQYSEEIESHQKILKELGLYTGTIDGLNGPGTQRAIKAFQNKAGLVADGVVGTKTNKALILGESAYVLNTDLNAENTSEVTQSPVSTASSANSAIDLINYNPNENCIEGYVNTIDVWVPDPCFYPVFVYRFGKTAQVNSQNELNSYLQARWSLIKEKVYTSIGPVSTQNYTHGINSPVNGLPMSPNANNSIVIGIKNDNNVRARPQSGPQNADAVVEVLVEGGMTRFINIFYQSDTTYHGPIRSARPTDPTVLRPLGGVLVASGATGGLIPEIIDMGVPVITDRRPEYFRISSRKAPHNLYADTKKLKSLAVAKGYVKSTTPQPLFAWGDPIVSNWAANTYLNLTFSSQTQTKWSWNGSNYVRTYYDAYKGSSSGNVHNWVDVNGNQGQISTTTVIALFCEPYIHPLQLPSVKTVGNGRAIILHQGKILDVFWKRGSNLDPFHIVDKNGNELFVPKGKVWISLVPNTTSPSFG